eukprot:5349663-Ditylum_brightwellii.AAC.1
MCTHLRTPGAKAIIHKKLEQRTSFGFHGVEGFTIGPSTDHNRCLQCFVPDIGAVINCDMLCPGPTARPSPPGPTY